MRAVLITASALMVLIALTTAMITLNYPITTYPSEEIGNSAPPARTQATQTSTNVTVAGVVEESKEVLREITVNGMVISLAGTWNCSGFNSPISGTELTHMLKPGSRVVIIGERSYVGLKALMVVIQGSGTYCMLIRG